ncbi:MAG: hypothetical protein HRT53_11410 [Colwellia sp.]|nr:hypothetical protein [Colwellia sp.]
MQKLQKIFIPAICATFSAIILTACSSMPTFQPISKDAVVVNAKKNTPELGPDFTLDIGENLLITELGNYAEKTIKSVTLLTPVRGEYGEYPSLIKGKTTALGMSDLGGNAACFNDAKYQGAMSKFCLFDEEKDGYFEMGSFNGEATYSLNVPYNIFSDINKTPEKGYLRKTLSYRGLLNGKINFNYSEYSGNMVRATLSQDFSIQNRKDAHIVFNFKGAEIKIKKANLLNVTYEVMQYFK